VWKVVYVPEAAVERDTLPVQEREALRAAVDKLKADGDQLGSPHSSAVQGVNVTLRELRPRRGRSPIRAFYRRIGHLMVIGAVGPEAQVDRRGFDRSVTAAIGRLADFEP